MSLLCNNIVLIMLCFTSIEAFFFKDNVDCLLTDWSRWSEQSSSGEQTRSRRIMRHPSGRGRPCEELTEIRVFQVDCKVSGWTKWSENFGFGQQSRTRTITQPSRGSGKRCPELEEVRYTGIVPSVKATAKNVENYFVRADRKYRKDNKNKKGLTRDLVIIMDSSGSIRKGPFQDAKIQTSKLIGLLCPSDKPFDKVAGQPYQYNQAAMLTYSHIIQETFDFKRYSKTSNIQNAISKATFFGRGTNTAEAFRRAKGLFTSAKGARDPTRAKREVLILTDGKSDNAAKTFAAVESLKRVADVYGLMTGRFSSNGMKELTKYVSAPINEHLFYVQNYQVLRKLVEYIQNSKNAAGPNWCATFDI
ncbi:matrilin-3-like [Mercenaria mercenaria]|uniref:matrilin-3-like n=1 Tax=Mercenaria mercenaria TaxID=6596 RepID=UPI00234F455B|nr:matrilin-3-like [Mercenaria mercenaria]